MDLQAAPALALCDVLQRYVIVCSSVRTKVVEAQANGHLGAVDAGLVQLALVTRLVPRSAGAVGKLDSSQRHFLNMAECVRPLGCYCHR